MLRYKKHARAWLGTIFNSKGRPTTGTLVRLRDVGRHDPELPDPDPFMQGLLGVEGPAGCSSVDSSSSGYWGGLPTST